MLRVARFRQAIRVWPHSEIFAGRRARKNACWELPNPLYFGTNCPKVPVRCTVVCGPSLSFLCLILTLVRYAEQMINVRFYCHGLPHLPLGIPVFCIKLFLLFPPAHGGMLQRIMIGIATAMKPALLIADEPTTAIDAITQYEILNELLHIKENHNTAMIFISHDLNAISRVADRIVVLNHGAVVDRGDFRHILHHAQDPYTKLLVEKRADVMRRYTAVLNGKKEAAHA